ncbi:MAG: hypothetical protein ACFFEJ_08655 [Candidatus Thorarchaeota archaeon]
MEKLRDRISELENRGLNGLDFLVVSIDDRDHAQLEIHFFNSIGMDVVSNHRDDPESVFVLEGGVRRLANKDFYIKSISEPVENTVTIVLEVRNGVSVLGDYTTYRIVAGPLLNPEGTNQNRIVDKLFDTLSFKFRPGCFNTQCDPKPVYVERQKEPIINYLAKDFETFKHTMIAAMGERIPGWKPTTEADLDMVLIELISATADELSDFQDRVMNEAYLNTARKRVSLARHARLMDYYIYEGHQATSWLAVQVKDDCTLDSPFSVSTMSSYSSIVYSTIHIPNFYKYGNRIGLYTWNAVVPTLDKGSTTADVQILDIGAGEDVFEVHETFKELILSGKIKHLLIQEWKDPATGLEYEGTGIIGKRQILRLVPNKDLTKTEIDPVTEEVYLRIVWEEEDKLLDIYTFTTYTNGSRVNHVSMFHANLLSVSNGEWIKETFIPPTEKLDAPPLETNQYYYIDTRKWGAICELRNPLLYTDVYNGERPTGRKPPISTLRVTVNGDDWDERISLINSESTHTHFIVETDEERISRVRFGNGINGMMIPEDAIIECEYQTGLPLDGNIGADTLVIPDPINQVRIRKCWNPLDISSGRDRETRNEIMRNVPEAFREMQLRAITVNNLVDDYESQTQILPEVHQAKASYTWMGSWRQVQIAVDPVGGGEITSDLHREILTHLDSVRLIGDQIIIRNPKYVPLEIHVPVCIHEDYWQTEVLYFLKSEFSDGITWDGRKAFFHPDRWTFGQSIKKSQIVGAVQSIEGVDHVIDNPSAPSGSLSRLSIEKWNRSNQNGQLEIGSNEIIQVRSNPNEIESGFIYFHLRGGRG